MDRQIKFRGKNLKNKKWVYGDLMSNICGTRIVRYKETDNGAKKRADWEYIDVEPDTVGQFTGLKDRFGQDVYEGDVLKLRDKGDTKENVCVVKWNGTIGAFCIRFSFEKKLGIRPLGLWIQESAIIEVIGNVFDNPELIK